MTSIRIWTLESDYSAKVVKSLAHELHTHSQLGDLSIQVSGKRSLPKRDRNGAPLSDALRTATLHCLKQDGCVIFVISKTRQTSFRQRQKKPLLVKQIEQFTKDHRFEGKVFLAHAVQEIKEWLPIAHKSLQMESMTSEEKWESVVSHFHNAFDDTPEEEVVRDLDKALAEVRRERT